MVHGYHSFPLMRASTVFKRYIEIPGELSPLFRDKKRLRAENSSCIKAPLKNMHVITNNRVILTHLSIVVFLGISPIVFPLDGSKIITML